MLIRYRCNNLQYNPFRYQLYDVFSSKKDRKFSFEDMLELCSIMSENCPPNVKATWAFRIFDINNDGLIDKNDLNVIIDRLTQGLDPGRIIDDNGKERIVESVRK